MSAYVSKGEKRIPVNDPSGKWTDMTLLPEWEEKYYNVYTAKKHGKWVMLKALKEEFAEDDKYRRMLEREFDTRYNLAHANIVMVNDFEDIPGIGTAIVTDDVYGYSLRQLIDEKKLSPKTMHRLQTQLLDAMDYIQENHIVHDPITPENIIITEGGENLKLINVGYDCTDALSEQDTMQDIRSYGKVLNEVLDHMPAKLPRLRKIAQNCESGNIKNVSDIILALERRSARSIYIFIIIFIVLMCGLIAWLSSVQ